VVGSGGLWRLYFDRRASDGAGAIAASADPGRMGGTALSIAGHAAFKFAVWRTVSRPRLRRGLSYWPGASAARTLSRQLG
jgi:hypothetical protein